MIKKKERERLNKEMANNTHDFRCVFSYTVQNKQNMETRAYFHPTFTQLIRTHPLSQAVHLRQNLILQHFTTYRTFAFSNEVNYPQTSPIIV